MFERRRSWALTKNERENVLKLARKTIEAKLHGLSSPEIDKTTSLLNKDGGAFVTLTKNKSLRGCIGLIHSERPLHFTIQEVAEAAAFRDPRFPPLAQDELQDTSIEISILSPMRKITSLKKIKVKRHGVFVKKGPAHGLLLPQVAVQNHWNRETFLEHVCIKAGLEKNAWKDPDTEIMIFDAQVFKEPSLDT
ncbi:MAG: AmmeMemoRadiSam system protein A [bacterium]